MYHHAKELRKKGTRVPATVMRTEDALAKSGVSLEHPVMESTWEQAEIPDEESDSPSMGGR